VEDLQQLNIGYLTSAFGNIRQKVVHKGVHKEGNDIVADIDQELVPALGGIALC
jgi:hypothetical protein